jgi:hypothetical protein
MNSEELRRRGGRRPKPAAPGKRVSLGLRVDAETKALLDAARDQGRSQAEEAARYIRLGIEFDKHGRWTLPMELQHLAVELIVAHSNGPTAVIPYLMSKARDEEQRWLLWCALRSALDTWLANNPMRPPASEQTRAKDNDNDDSTNAG